MNNSQYNTLDVKRVCENKLGIQFRGTKECNGWFEYAGKKIARVTIPKGRKPIPPKTYKKMADQLNMAIQDFDALLDCPLSVNDYLNILRVQALIP